MVNIENPIALWLLAPVIVFIFGLGFWGWRAKREFIEIFKIDIVRAKKNQIVKQTISGIILVLLVISIVYSGFLHEPEKKPQVSGQIAFLVDVSGSQAAQILPHPNRLERVRIMLSEIIDRLPGEEFSIHGFTNMSRSLAPFTKDHLFLKRTIERVLDIFCVPGIGTTFGEPLLNVIDKFPENEEQKNKIIILFSDGEFFHPRYLGQIGQPSPRERELIEKALNNARQRNIRIITVGVGKKQGEPIPLFDQEGNFIEYVKRGKEIYLTYLNEELLEKIAFGAGGRYFSEKDLEDIINYIETILGNREREERERKMPYLLLFPIVFLWVIFAKYYFR